jgi:hypothetical protein
MFTLRVLDLVAVALFCSRRQVSRVAKAALAGGCAFLVWYQNPVPCTCIRLPLVRCESALPWRAMVRSDLRNLASQQEIHRMDHGRYSADPGPSASSPATAWRSASRPRRKDGAPRRPT